MAGCEEPDDDIYYVEEVLSERPRKPKRGEKTTYLVRWMDYEMKDCTWEPEENFQGPDILQEWEAKKAGMSRAELETRMTASEAEFDAAIKAADEEHKLKQRKITQPKQRRSAKPRKRKTIAASDSENEEEHQTHESVKPRNGKPVAVDSDDSDAPLLLHSLPKAHSAMTMTQQADAVETTYPLSLVNVPAGNEGLEAANPSDVNPSIKGDPIARQAHFEQSNSQNEKGVTNTGTRRTGKGAQPTSATPSRHSTALIQGNSILTPTKALEKGILAVCKAADHDKQALHNRAEDCALPITDAPMTQAPQNQTPVAERATFGTVKRLPIHNNAHIPVAPEQQLDPSQKVATTLLEAELVANRVKSPKAISKPTTKHNVQTITKPPADTSSRTATQPTTKNFAQAPIRSAAEPPAHPSPRSVAKRPVNSAKPISEKTSPAANSSLTINTQSPASSLLAKNSPVNPICMTRQRRPSTTSSSIRSSTAHGAAKAAALPAIRMTNEPRTERRECKSNDRQSKTQKFRTNAEKHSRKEIEPDFAALQFVNGKPARLPETTQRGPSDDPYGRREIRNRRAVEDDNEISQGGNVNETTRRVEKIPLVCYDWRMGSNCPYEGTCRFMHRNQDENGNDYRIGLQDGSVPPKYRNPPLTCRFWLTNATGCRNTDDECLYAHRNTGFMPNKLNNGTTIQINAALVPVFLGNTERANIKPKPPYTEITCFFWSQGECNKSDEACAFRHYHTGIVEAPPPGYSGSRFPIPVNKLREPLRGSRIAGEPEKGVYKTTTVVDESQAEYGTVATAKQVKMFEKPTTITNGLPASTRAPTAIRKDQKNIGKPARPSYTSAEMRSKISRALKVEISELFSTDDGREWQVLSKRALLIYHPIDHLEELELLTRYLLLHNVEVSSAWMEGCWDLFRAQFTENAACVVIAHPKFESYADLPGFGQLLQKPLKFWSLGMQEHDVGEDTIPVTATAEPTKKAAIYPRNQEQACIEIFPLGGFVYITDDVFEKEPQFALKIIKLFFSKICALRFKGGVLRPLHAKGVAPLIWRFCVRPELMERLHKICELREPELASGHPDNQAIFELYLFLSDSKNGLIEQDHAIGPIDEVSDRYPILSERRIIAEDPALDYFKALSRSQEEANLQMIRYYAAMQVDMRRNYRHFFVVHTEPLAPYVSSWKQDVQSIGKVITPEECIRQLEKTGKESLFDFHERYTSLF